MFGWLIRRRLAAFERTYQYDASYVREILETDESALWLLAKVEGMSKYRAGVSPDARCAAAIRTLMAEDCGPCTQLVVTMAEREGVDPAVLRAIVAHDLAAMSDDAALGFRFAEAVLAHAPEADALRAEAEKRWGKKGVLSLAFAMTTARFYPTLKYALGHGQACVRLKVGGAHVPVAHPQVV